MEDMVKTITMLDVDDVASVFPILISATFVAVSVTPRL